MKDYEGKDMASEGKPMTLGVAISTAINATIQDKPLTPEQKGQAFAISAKIWGNKEAELTVEDMAFVKKRVLLIWNPLVSGRVAEILESKAE